MSSPTRVDLDEHIYPDSDGERLSDNTLQFLWIMMLQGNLDALYRHDQNVFVAGDLLWYPVRGRPKVRAAPDALVVFGRPKGYRGSYKQWEEGGIAPQVVFEVASPGNRPEQMDQKFDFYERYGVEEYYLYNPDTVELLGWRRNGGLEPIDPIDGWVSPRLGIRFDLSGEELVIYRPDGQRFLSFVELEEQREQAQHQAREAQRETREAQRETREAQRETEAARQRIADLAAKLRALGVDPDA
jgi:Uma2 family endonuclease